MKKIYTLCVLTYWILNLLPGQNLIVNPSAEMTPVGNGWTQVSGNWQQRLVSPDPQHGAAYFFAGANSNAELYQDVDVSSYATIIDQSGQEFTFSGYTSSWPGSGLDDSRLMVEYRNAVGSVLDTYDTGWVQSLSWLQRTDTRIAPVGTRIIRIRIRADRDDGNNNDGYSDNLSLTTANILPVELVYFKAASNDNTIRLTWQTASELDNRGFEIQKSDNGNVWEKIDFVEGEGTTIEVEKYEYDDSTPFLGINYYRLKQIDYDGTFEYSKVIAAEYQYFKKNIQVFPNPSNGLINIQIENPLDQSMKVRITDDLGKKILENRVLEGDSNWKKEIEIEGNGVYFISVQVGDQVYNEKIIITN